MESFARRGTTKAILLVEEFHAPLLVLEENSILELTPRNSQSLSMYGERAAAAVGS